MVALADWFKANRYQGKRHLGERVTGVYKGIRWMGTLGVDNEVNELEGPLVTVLLDLPLKIDDKVHNILRIKSKDVKPLKELDL